MPKRKSIKPLTVLDELRALEQTPPKKVNRLIARHLQCEESLKLSSAVAEATRRSLHNTAPAMESPTEILPPLV